MKRLFSRGRYANVTSTLASVLAPGGTSYAAVTLPVNSVDGRQIMPGAVDASDIEADAVSSMHVKDGTLRRRVFAAGELASRRGTSAKAAAISGPTFGVLGYSFVNTLGTSAAPSRRACRSAAQVSLLSPGKSGGLITISERGQLHADASIRVTRSEHAGNGLAFCTLYLSGSPISDRYAATFAAPGSPYLPTDTISLTGAADDIGPGTYNVGIRCYASEPNVLSIQNAGLHAVVYAK